MARLPISCCYILKNEEEFLEASLHSVASHVEELIICDSGSTDRSLEIVEMFRNNVPRLEVFHRDWTDDFSAARNFTASRAKQPWIFFVDGDEWISEADWKEIENCVRQSNVSVFSMLQKNYTLRDDVDGAELCKDPLPDPIEHHQDKMYFTKNYMERLYKSDLGLQYDGRIHESLLPSCHRLKLNHLRTSVTLHHFGRLKKDVGDKYLYYLELTRKKLEEQPTNPAPWIETIINLLELREFKSAFDFAQRAVAKFRDEPEIIQVAYKAALRVDEWKLAEKWIRNFLSLRPDDIYAKTQLTTALLYQRRFRDVMAVAEEIFEVEPENFVVHVNCATVFFELGEWEKAARHIAAGLKVKPNDKFLNDAMSKIPTNFQIR